MSPSQQTEHPWVPEASLVLQAAEGRGVGSGCRVASVV